MIESLGSIPSHPLLVHVPVVLVPLSMVATTLMIMSSSARRRYGSLAVALLTIAFVGTVFAARSGHALETEYEKSGRNISDLLRDHADMGSRLQYVVGVYLILSMIWIVRSRRPIPLDADDDPTLHNRRIVSAILAFLVVTSAIASTASTLHTGHSGLRSVWERPLTD